MTGVDGAGRSTVLIDGPVLPGPGDCLIQRGTNHAWRVGGDEPCTFAAVFLPSSASTQGK